NLDVYEGSLSINGSIDISGDLIIADDSKINGVCDVRGSILSSFLKVNGPLNAESMDGTEFWLPSKVNVKTDIMASEAIVFNVSKNHAIIVGGIIEAPEVTFRKKRSFNPLKKLVGLLSKTKRDVSEILITDVSIKTEKLFLRGVELEGDIDAGEVIYLE
ncbi:MAG: hypothetical protein KAR35_10360, partial [Candidatus Heimdallarchaeota archaeon]|nr:hypothetical protein [Candidatus Heimdallarchaeota archaeon]MCK5049759.1 hypothetical protein [Candidatus Heimdallarchaeota archaeon]